MSQSDARANGIRQMLNVLEQKNSQFMNWCKLASRGMPPLDNSRPVTEYELATVEQLIRDMSAAVTGTTITHHDVWAPFAQTFPHLQRKLTEWSDLAEFGKWLQVWIDKTRLYVSYLEGYANKEPG